MEEKNMWGQFHFIRSRTIQSLKNITEETANQVPEGYRNSIKWNIGHILITYDNLLAKFTSNGEKQISDKITPFFSGGTSPETWESEPSSLDELLELLKKQQGEIISLYSGRLEEPLTSRITFTEQTEMDTIRDLLQFTYWHEGLHQGVINGLKYSLGQM
ncbi:putative damage-inducible protein DinB [Peribacillus deserti]|uniref:Damage-inducible protein DinB n=1 Tax=Peribacillus deserti TaxID=673318 RepID=A0ABS2QDN5_9BACI|nr:DinB family protein [Peribacillus deserti]MBM7690608.1 putative damage-inducible protein DinB [Peribacillus deserti]